VCNFKGDKYLRRDEINKFIKPKNNENKKVARIATSAPKKRKKRFPIISYENYLLSQIFADWLGDNMAELKETFNEIVYCHQKNNAIFEQHKDTMFKEYTGMVFRSNIAQIKKDYA
tara:strand:- start:1779 stop:2126 length:348 start_codon:yes stop_codon:yes gene_type:complete